jgi:hypothetical protein
MLAVAESTDERRGHDPDDDRVDRSASRGTRGEAHERKSLELRDLARFGRPARFVWRKWRCRDDAWT